MLRINCQTIQHDQQRYSTVGDWWFDADGVLQVRVSDLGDWKSESAVAVHEIIEALLCEAAGVQQKQVDEFDKKFEALRLPGNTSEPGDSPTAPYARQHCIATGIERLFVAELGLKWFLYEKRIEEL